ncbi:MAG: hypothetical protein CMM02_08175 [Rhodopirellula sp.]|nr:hypothetical protein [Rhodopirellula sp.]MAT10970.1 hypothetical protein [Rhodopirellula sp.]
MSKRSRSQPPEPPTPSAVTSDPQDVRTLALTVCSDFHDKWLEQIADPIQTTDLLKFALSLPRAREGTDVEAICAALTSTAVREQESRCAKHVEEVRRLERELLVARRDNEELHAAAGRADLAASERSELDARRLADQIANASAEETAALRASVQKLSNERLELQQRFGAESRERLEEVVRLTRDNAELAAEIETLRTPTARGRVGEWLIGDVLTEHGFGVSDTSMGARKDEGYMDLLAWPLSDPTLKIAIECKNRAKIDPGTDLAVFEQKAGAGVANGLFHSAIFVSLRAHTKKAEPQVVEMVADGGGVRCVPVSYVGPERGADAPSLARETLVAHVAMHLRLVQECAELRRSHRAQISAAQERADDSAAAANASRVAGELAAFAERLRDDAQAALDEMTTMSRAVASLQASIKTMRIRAVRSAFAIGAVRERCGDAAAWLENAKFQVWCTDMQAARDRAASGNSDALIWKNMSDPQKKRAVDAFGTRETFFAAAHRLVDDAAATSDGADDQSNISSSSK